MELKEKEQARKRIPLRNRAGGVKELIVKDFRSFLSRTQ
jgi:hypothetical protein